MISMGIGYQIIAGSYLRCLHGAQESGTLFLFLTTRNCASGECAPALDDVVEGGVGVMMANSRGMCTRIDAFSKINQGLVAEFCDGWKGSEEHAASASRYTSHRVGKATSTEDACNRDACSCASEWVS